MEIGIGDDTDDGDDGDAVITYQFREVKTRVKCKMIPILENKLKYQYQKLLGPYQEAMKLGILLYFQCESASPCQAMSCVTHSSRQAARPLFINELTLTNWTKSF